MAFHICGEDRDGFNDPNKITFTQCKVIHEINRGVC